MKRSESPEYISSSQCGGSESQSDRERFDALPAAEQDRILAARRSYIARHAAPVATPTAAQLAAADAKIDAAMADAERCERPA